MSEHSHVQILLRKSMHLAADLTFACPSMLRRLTAAVQALQRVAVSTASIVAAQLAPIGTRLLTSVPVDVSDVQVLYRVRTYFYSRALPSVEHPAIIVRSDWQAHCLLQCVRL